MEHLSARSWTVILWGLFIAVVLTGIIYLFDRLSGDDYRLNPLNGLLDFSPLSLSVLVLAVALLVLHAAWTLGCLRGCAFLLIAFFMGLFFEIMGVDKGIFFGGSYYYHSSNQPLLLGVPLLVPIMWAAFIYAGYSIVTSFLHWLNAHKPNRHGKNAVLLPLLVLADGLVVVAIDLLMEPLQVAAGNWVWLDPGCYFNIPASNFAGWFAVVAISTATFRVFEYFLPPQSPPAAKSLSLIPVIGYGMLCLALISSALKLQFPAVALIGFLTMLPITIANIILPAARRTAAGRVIWPFRVTLVSVISSPISHQSS